MNFENRGSKQERKDFTMIVQCHKCNKYFEDEYRTYVCPHDTFNANDGLNNFAVHSDSYLSPLPPKNEVNRRKEV